MDRRPCVGYNRLVLLIYFGRSGGRGVRPFWEREGTLRHLDG
jgi:hypothetical protein